MPSDLAVHESGKNSQRPTCWRQRASCGLWMVCCLASSVDQGLLQIGGSRGFSGSPRSSSAAEARQEVYNAVIENSRHFLVLRPVEPTHDAALLVRKPVICNVHRVGQA